MTETIDRIIHKEWKRLLKIQNGSQKIGEGNEGNEGNIGNDP